MKRRERETLDYFRFDAVDWLTSPVVSCMTPAQEGAFIRLLAYQAKTKDCSLPDSDPELATLSRLGEAWSTVGAFVRAQFESDTEKPGRIFNKKLRAEWGRRVELRDRYRKCARRCIPVEIRREVYKRDGRRCIRCGSRRDLTLDHIKHYSRGGADTVENLRTFCRPCNASRGNRESA